MYLPTVPLKSKLPVMWHFTHGMNQIIVFNEAAILENIVYNY